MKAGPELLSNYSSIKKNDIRNDLVKTFVNGGQDNLYRFEKKYSVSPKMRNEATDDLERDNQELLQQLENHGL